MFNFKKMMFGISCLALPLTLSVSANAEEKFSLKEGYVSQSSNGLTQFSYLDDMNYINVGLSLLKKPSTNRPYFQTFYTGLNYGSRYLVSFETLNSSSLKDNERVNFYAYGTNDYVYDGNDMASTGGWCSRAITNDSSTQKFTFEFTALGTDFSTLFVMPSSIYNDYENRKDFGFGYKIKVDELSDTESPILKVYKDIDLEVGTPIRINEKYLIDNRLIYAEDNYSGVITSNVKIVKNDIDYFIKGRYVITLEVSDNANNKTQANLYVNIVDKVEKPTDPDIKPTEIKFKDFTTNAILVNKTQLTYDEIKYVISEKYGVKISSLYGYCYENTEEALINDSDVLDVNSALCVAYYIEGETSLSSCVIKFSGTDDVKEHWYDWFINILNKIIDWFKNLFSCSSDGTTGTTTTTTTSKIGE